MKKTLLSLAALLLIIASFTGCDAVKGLIFGEKASLGEKVEGSTTTLEGAIMKYVSDTNDTLTVTIDPMAKNFDLLNII